MGGLHELGVGGLRELVMGGLRELVVVPLHELGERVSDADTEAVGVPRGLSQLQHYHILCRAICRMLIALPNIIRRGDRVQVVGSGVGAVWNI